MFSLYFVYGQNGGFRWESTNSIKRLVLGKICFVFVKRDIEVIVELASKIIKESKENKEC